MLLNQTLRKHKALHKPTHQHCCRKLQPLTQQSSESSVAKGENSVSRKALAWRKLVLPAINLCLRLESLNPPIWKYFPIKPKVILRVPGVHRCASWWTLIQRAEVPAGGLSRAQPVRHLMVGCQMALVGSKALQRRSCFVRFISRKLYYCPTISTPNR